MSWLQHLLLCAWTLVIPSSLCSHSSSSFLWLAPESHYEAMGTLSIRLVWCFESPAIGPTGVKSNMLTCQNDWLDGFHPFYRLLPAPSWYMTPKRRILWCFYSAMTCFSTLSTSWYRLATQCPSRPFSLLLWLFSQQVMVHNHKLACHTKIYSNWTRVDLILILPHWPTPALALSSVAMRALFSSS